MEPESNKFLNNECNLLLIAASSVFNFKPYSIN